MTEEKLISETGEQVEDMTPDYLSAIKDLKKNSVNREEYDKLKAENKRLLDTIVNGQDVEVEEEPKYRDVGEIREELFNHEHNNLDYVKLALELRNSRYWGSLTYLYLV